MNIFSQKIKPYIAFVALLSFCLFAFSFLVIKDFQHPLSGGGDTDYFEYTGFYFGRNFKLSPFPHLNLTNNQAFYPYGVNSVFQPWSLERDIIYSLLYSSVGFGPWLQFYYVFSLAVTALGTLLLLRRDYGIARAAGIAAIVTFFNFYAFFNYPVHLVYSIAHWTILSFVTDFILVKRVVLRQHISVTFIMIRIAILILSLGQELGYIAGYALMSLTVSLVFIIIILGYRYIKNREINTNRIKALLSTYWIELLKNPIKISLLLCLILFLSYLYIPLIFQISKEAKSFDFSRISDGYWWINPLRLFIPFFPILNPLQDVTASWFTKIFKDHPEAIVFADGSPSLFLIIISFIGLYQSRRKLNIFIPLLIILTLCILYVPGSFSIKTIIKLIFLIIAFLCVWLTRQRITLLIPLLLFLLGLFVYKVAGWSFPTLKIFPWFAFNRVPSRSTVIYPVILSLLAININFSHLPLLKRRLIILLLTSLVCIELYTAYSFKFAYQPYLIDKDVMAYMNYIKQQPGEAVLDWPFCITGGNGVGADRGLCPLYGKNGSIFALRRFHEKKVMGQYFGRLHPSQLEDYLRAGWDKLLVADNPNIFTATQLARCFSPQEWEFFTKFYESNDFAGINLYVDLLPQECAIEFYRRYGNPKATTNIPWLGKIEFLQKTAEQRRKVNPKLGVELKYISH